MNARVSAMLMAASTNHNKYNVSHYIEVGWRHWLHKIAKLDYDTTIRQFEVISLWERGTQFL